MNVPQSKDIERSIPGSIGISSQDLGLKDIIFNEVFLSDHVKEGEGITPATNIHKMGLIFQGHAQAKTRIDNQRWCSTQLQTSDIYITPAQRKVQWSWSNINKQPLICLAFHISDTLIKNIFEETFDKCSNTLELELHNSFQDPLLTQVIIDIYKQLKTNTPNALYIETTIRYMLIRLIQKKNKRQTSIKEYQKGFSTNFLQLLLNHIDDNLDQNISIEKLSTYSNMSKYHFMRIFQRSMGQSCHQYIIEKRLQRADNLLKNTKLSITQIGLEVGYERIANFSLAYKKNRGLSPKQFRQLNCA